MHVPIFRRVGSGALQQWRYRYSAIEVTATDMEMRLISNSLQWRHNESDCVSDHWPHDCLLNRLFRRRSKNTSKLRVTGLCAGNSSVTGEFPAQKASNAEIFPFDNVIIYNKTSTNLLQTDSLFKQLIGQVNMDFPGIQYIELRISSRGAPGLPADFLVVFCAVD